jgi:hypothetical protein
VTKILETIADSSPIREGLHDDEALPLIDWGTQCASHLGQRLAAPGTPAPEQVDNTAYNLTRLMTRINWLATYRTKKDAGWLTRTFQMINQLARELFGDDAPVMSDPEVAAWLTDNARLTNGEVVQALIARFSPAGMAAPPPEAATPAPPSTGQGPVFPGRDAPESAPPVTPSAGQGSVLPGRDTPESAPSTGPGPVLPGRAAPPPLSEESSAPGEKHDQTEQ